MSVSKMRHAMYKYKYKKTRRQQGQCSTLKRAVGSYRY